MSTIELLKPILEGGIENPNFFNGRLLTGEDLQDLQNAEQHYYRALGASMGEGVVNGLEVIMVSSSEVGALPSASITKGMALNRAGQVLELKQDITLNLVRGPSIPSDGEGKGLFAPCRVLNPVLVPTGTGVYILVVAPASGNKGRAPKLNLDDNGKISDCGPRYRVDGLQFKLIPLDITDSSIVAGDIGNQIRIFTHYSGVANHSKLRNLLAHLCLGTEPGVSFTTDVFRSSGSSAALLGYGPLDALRNVGCLTNTDVPLALILWTQTGLEFVDMWPVRRKVHNPYVFTYTPYPMTSRRAAELEAGHLQFQEHIETLLDSAASIKAVDYFRYLPAVGMIPHYSTETDKKNKDIHFFADLTTRDPVFIEGIKLRDLVQQSFSFEPMDVKEKELIWLYQVRQNMRKVEQKPTVGGQAYLVFSSGYIPFRGEAQYDLSRYDYSNYSPGVAGYFR